MTGRPFDLRVYLAIVFALSWPFQFISVLGPHTLAWACAFNSISMIMVGVATFICARFVFRDGFAGAGWRWGRGRYYAFAVGVPAAMWVVPAVVDLATGGLTWPRVLSRTQLAWVFEMLFIVLIPAFGEEIGWRGYMLPRMAARMSPRRAVVWHGVIWYVWHLPIVAFAAVNQMSAYVQGLTLILAAAAALLFGIVVVVLDSAIFAWLWAGSGSIAVVTVFHAASDGFRDSLGITVGCGPVGEIWAPVLTIVLGALLLWKTDWGRLFERMRAGDESAEG